MGHINDITPTDKEGLAHGLWIRHWDCGNLYYTGTFKHGSHIGLCDIYWSTGEQHSKLYYII